MSTENSKPASPNPATPNPANPTRLIGSASVLLVEDVAVTAHYYRDQLGFTFERFWGEPPCFCILEHGGVHLMVSKVEDPESITPNHRASDGLWDVYFWVDDIEAFYASVKARGAMIAEPPTDQPHGCRECVVKDPNGYLIAFGQVLEDGSPPTDPSHDEPLAR